MSAPTFESNVWRSNIRQGLSRAENWADGHRGIAGLVLAVIYFLQALGRSPQKLFWNDEYLVYWTAKLPGWGAIWTSLRELPLPIDPPLYHFLTHLGLVAGLPSELAVRMPSLLGFGVMLLCVYAFLVRRVGVPVAFAVATFLQAAPLQYYEVEGRPYGFVTGCIAVALLCWQRAADPERTGTRWWAVAGIVVSLSAALASHYFAGLAVASLAVGELERTLRTRKIDLPVWVSLLLPSLVVLCYLPLLPAALVYKSLTVAPPGVTELLVGYELSYSPLLLPALVVASLWPWRRDSIRPTPAQPRHEIVSALTLFLLPCAGLLAGRFLTGHYEGRYTLSFVIGTGILLGYALRRYHAQALGFALLLGIGALIFGTRGGLLELLRHAPPASAALGSYDAPVLERYPDLAIAIDSSELLYGAAIYGNPAWKQRVVGVVNPRRLVNYETGGLATFLNWSRRGWTSTPMQDEQDFLESHRRFLMWGDKYIWPNLVSKNAEIQFEGLLGPERVYLVTLP